MPAAALYLALLATNALNFWRSVSFTVGAVCAVVLLVAGWQGRTARIPSPGWVLPAVFVAWCLWCTASIAWSVHPAYSVGQLRGEILWSFLVALMVYVAARDDHAWRTMVGAVLAVFGVAAALALVLQLLPSGWNPGRWHLGVGPWTTFLVLITPWLLTLAMAPPFGFARDRRVYWVGALLFALLLATARISDNRMVWIALATVLVVMTSLAALRWRRSALHSPARWLVPLGLAMLTMGALFADSALERAQVFFPPDTTVAQSLADDPRLELWEHMVERIRARPWLGYGFGRAILATELRAELGDPLLWHAHNMFASQWLQTGAIGLALFVALLLALAARYIAFLRSRSDTLALVGLVGLAMLSGFVVKNLTDDFLFRANAKQFFALNALLLGLGMRLQRPGGPAMAPAAKPSP